MTRLTFVTTLFVILTLATLVIHTPAKANTGIGNITRVQASASVNGKTAHTGDVIYPGSTIVTDEKGRIEITFNDSTVLTLAGSTEFIVDEFSYNSAATLPKAVLKLTKGAFRTMTSTLVDANPENFVVITPLATIGIRGTDFWGGYLSPVEIDIVMLKGKGVVVTSMGGTVILEEAGVGVSVPDPTKHEGGYAKALMLPEKSKWGAQKLEKAAATVMFD